KELSDRVKDLKKERDEWRATASDQVEKIQSLEKDLEPRIQQLKVAEEKIGEEKHRELFTMPYQYIQKVAGSYDLSMSELLEVSSDVPPPSKDEEASSNVAAGGTA
ncbi:hypothetical protein Tco_1373416, partial [Tanacetum coccineum]